MAGRIFVFEPGEPNHGDEQSESNRGSAERAKQKKAPQVFSDASERRRL